MGLFLCCLLRVQTALNSPKMYKLCTKLTTLMNGIARILAKLSLAWWKRLQTARKKSRCCYCCCTQVGMNASMSAHIPVIILLKTCTGTRTHTRISRLLYNTIIPQYSSFKVWNGIKSLAWVKKILTQVVELSFYLYFLVCLYTDEYVRTFYTCACAIPALFIYTWLVCTRM